MKISNSNETLKPPEGLTSSLAEQSRKRRKLMRGLAEQQEHRGPPRNDLSPKLVLEHRPIAELKPAARRLRKNDPLQIDRIRSSIETYGICQPVLITGTGEIVDGHLVIEAAKSLGLQEVPCIVIDHLSPADVRRLRISLNRLAETGTWDFPELKVEIQDLAVEFGEKFEIPGLEPAELDLILQVEDDDAAKMAADDAVPAVQQTAVSRLGDIWRLGPHRLGCGDAKDPDFILRLAAAATIRLCLTDPPYGVKIVGHVTSGPHREFVEGGGGTTKEELYALFRYSFRVIDALLVDGGLCMAFIDWRSIQIMLEAGEDAGFSLLNLVVWGKTNAGLGSLYRSHHELLPVFKKGKAAHVNNVSLGRKGRYRTNLWTYPGASSLGSDARKGLEVHPTVKPVAMLADAILDVTNRRDIVFDPFSGSGSTLIAAHRTGRIFRGSELDPLYLDVILRRWIELTGEQPVLEATGQPFSAIVDRNKE
jgi:DNA modification methylase